MEVGWGTGSMSSVSSVSSTVAAQDRLHNQSLGSENNVLVYHLFCIFFIIIIIFIVIVIIPSFAVLLNCLYLNP